MYCNLDILNTHLKTFMRAFRGYEKRSDLTNFASIHRLFLDTPPAVVFNEKSHNFP